MNKTEPLVVLNFKLCIIYSPHLKITTFLLPPSDLGTFPGLLPSSLGRRPGKQRTYFFPGHPL